MASCASFRLINYSYFYSTPRQAQKELDPELSASEWCQNWKAADQGLS